MSTPKKLPEKPGFYWARAATNWFHLIVRVHGEAPFFRCEA